MTASLLQPVCSIFALLACLLASGMAGAAPAVRPPDSGLPAASVSHEPSARSDGARAVAGLAPARGAVSAASVQPLPDSTGSKAGVAPSSVRRPAGAAVPAAVPAVSPKIDARHALTGDPAHPRPLELRVLHNGRLSIRLPAVVEEGGILPIYVTRSPSSLLQLRWQGRTISLTRPANGSPVLLPVPLEGGGRTVQLGIRVQNTVLQTSIRVLPVAWPVQKLTVQSRYVRPPEPEQERIAADRARTRAALASLALDRVLGGPPFVHPVEARISSVFGGKRVFNGEPRSRHTGVDLGAPAGTPVRAAADGRVLLAAPQYFSGNIIWIDHGLGLVTVYCHLSEMHVREGEPVCAGQTLGLVGATGRVTGPHLHFGARLWHQHINPLALFTLPAGSVPQTARR